MTFKPDLCPPGFDILNGYGGDDRLGSTGGSDIINGGEGSDTSLYLNRFISDVNVDLADPVKWKYNRATGEWESGSGEGYTYIRATYRHEYDDDGDGVYDDFRIEHDYMTSIENLEASANGSVRGVVSNNVFQVMPRRISCPSQAVTQLWMGATAMMKYMVVIRLIS